MKFSSSGRCPLFVHGDEAANLPRLTRYELAKTNSQLTLAGRRSLGQLAARSWGASTFLKDFYFRSVYKELLSDLPNVLVSMYYVFWAQFTMCSRHHLQDALASVYTRYTAKVDSL